MGIERLDHVNIQTHQLNKMIAWYTDVLGLEQGWRPDFPFGGAWLYAGDAAVVHLVVGGEDAVGSEATLKLEHFALSATDMDGFLARLAAHDVPFRKSELAAAGLVQVNVWDPDGNHIHVDFKVGN